MAYQGTEGTRPYRGSATFYARYRPKLSDGFITLVRSRLPLRASARLLDLGTGPGQIALRFAPHVAEVIAVDVEPDMVAEGRRQAAATGAANVHFLVGAAERLVELADEIGMVAAVTIGEAFHWMVDREAVLAALGERVERRGAVLLIRTGAVVEAPDEYFELLGRVDAILQRHLHGTEPGPHPRGRHPAFEDILARSPFPHVDHIVHGYDDTIAITPEAFTGSRYAVSHVLARLGTRRGAFEDEVRAELQRSGVAATAVVRREDSALVGLRSG